MTVPVVRARKLFLRYSWEPKKVSVLPPVAARLASMAFWPSSMPAFSAFCISGEKDEGLKGLPGSMPIRLKLWLSSVSLGCGGTQNWRRKAIWPKKSSEVCWAAVIGLGQPGAGRAGGTAVCVNSWSG